MIIQKNQICQYFSCQYELIKDYYSDIEKMVHGNVASDNVVCEKRI